MLIVIGRTASEVTSNSVKVYRGITFLYPDRIHGPGVRRFALQHEVVGNVAQRSGGAGIGEHLERKAVRAGPAWVSDGSGPVVQLQARHLRKLAGVIGDQRGLLA